MRIVVEGTFSPVSSYGIVNLNLGCELARRGHVVAFVSLDIEESALGDVLARESCEQRISLGEPATPADVRIRQVWPPMWTRRHARERLVVIQPWEFGAIPLEWLDGVRSVDAIWVPSEYSKRGYVQAGVEPAKVWVVPNGVSVGDAPVPRTTTSSDDVTRLLYVGGTIFRKGVDVLVEALDTIEDDVLAHTELLIKDVGSNSFYVNQSILTDALDAHPRVRARTRVEARHLERSALRELFMNAHALVHPYRSEGFGLPVLEAMSLGTPVIHTQGGATNEFCGPDESILIPSTLTVAESARVGQWMLADRCYWREPSAVGLGEQISDLVAGRLDVSSRVDAARRRSLEFGWDRVGETAEAALADLCLGVESSDELSRLDVELGQFLDSASGSSAALMSRLVAIGDFESARGLAALVEARTDLDERAEIASVRERLSGLCDTSPDVWSGAPYRGAIASAQFEKGDHFAYVHDFEGGDHATYAIAERLSHFLAGSSSVLDIACGQGSMLRVLRAQGKRVQGIEADPALVEALRADGFHVHEGFVPQELSAMDSVGFDGVFLGHIVEHLTPIELGAVLDWVYEHIEDHGLVLIQTPDFATSGVGLENFWLDATHVRPYPVRLLKAMLSKSGFVPIQGACGPVRDIAPLDVVALARRAPRRHERAVRTSRARHSRTIAHYGLFHGTSGFSHASRDLLDRDALRAGGAKVVEVSVDAPDGPISSRPTIPLRQVTTADHDVAIVDVPLGWLFAVGSQARARHRIARTTFEAVPVPYDLLGTLRSFDEVWCFSSFDAAIFTDSGIDPARIAIVPPGIDAPEPALVRTRRASVARGAFSYLSIFNFEPRKNPEALIRAFAQVAAREPVCTLTLKVSSVSAPDFEAWLHKTLTPAQASVLRGRLRVITSSVTREALSKLYLSSDVFVLPSRGEGYGLPFLEALAHGLATICPDVGGHRDFCTEANSLLVRTSPRAAGPIVGSGVFRESLWREVDAEHLSEQMLRALRQPAALSALGEQGLRDAAGFTVTTYHAKSHERLAHLFAQGAP